MLRIGEFSALSQISIYMLRHYDEIGLLIPEHVDDFTGYRYYSECQLPIANKIQALKSMGLSLPLIKEILTKYANDYELKTYLETQAIQQKEKIELMQRQLTLIESTIKGLGRPSPIPSYSVALKEFPQHNLHYTSPQWNIAIFHDGKLIEENLDVEVQKSVVGTYQRTGLATFKTVDAFTAATLTFKGHYMNLPAVNEAIARWIVDNHYKISGPRFNIYHISPETENSFEDMITEVCFPVQSK